MAAVTTTQRRVRLSREGWFYAIVLGFIVCGAVLREVNLLFILAAVMMGPLFLGWRVARGALGEISAFRHGPRRAHAGNLAPLELEITNGRGQLLQLDAGRPRLAGCTHRPRFPSPPLRRALIGSWESLSSRTCLPTQLAGRRMLGGPWFVVDTAWVRSYYRLSSL
jgi:hypothetical protein